MARFQHTDDLYSSPPPADWFWGKVDRRGPEECWPWLGGRNQQDYGRIRLKRDGKYPSFLATRIAWALEHGKPFPRELYACHSCDNPPCVNPAHLWAGTNGDNQADRVAKGRRRVLPPLRRGLKLSVEDARNIIAEIERGAELTAIARKFGVDPSCIGQIKRGQIWQGARA